MSNHRGEPPTAAPPAQHSWKRPGFWRRAYAFPWVVLATVLAGATLGSAPTWFGVVTLGGIVAAVFVFFLALLPAIGFVLAQGKGRLFTVAALGILHAFVLLIAAGTINPSEPVFRLILALLLAAAVTSLVAIVVLLPWDVPLGEG